MGKETASPNVAKSHDTSTSVDTIRGHCIVVGAVGVMILGFSWGGWILGSTAESMAKARADEAVTAVLVPICVEKFGSPRIVVMLYSPRGGDTR